MRLVLFLTALVLTACATTALQSVAIPYHFVDEPERGGFTISYTNRVKRALCLTPSQWPTQAGFMNSPENRVFLRVGEQRYSMKEHNTGYCFGGCPVRVEPGATLTTFVSYERFHLPLELASAPKDLEFSPSAYPCPRD